MTGNSALNFEIYSVVTQSDQIAPDLVTDYSKSGQIRPVTPLLVLSNKLGQVLCKGSAKIQIV